MRPDTNPPPPPPPLDPSGQPILVGTCLELTIWAPPRLENFLTLENLQHT